MGIYCGFMRDYEDLIPLVPDDHSGQVNTESRNPDLGFYGPGQFSQHLKLFFNCEIGLK